MSFFSSLGHAIGGIAKPILGLGGAALGGMFGDPALGAELGTVAGGLFGGGSAHQAGQQARDAANRGAQYDINTAHAIGGMENPWISAGGGSQANLDRFLGIGPGAGSAGYGSLLKPYQFGEKAPGQFDFSLNDFYKYSPAYQFQKQQGMQGVLNGGAAGQGALSGAAQKDLMGYNQGLANTAWGNAYNQALGKYQTNFGRYMDLNQLGFGQYTTQQGNIYNRLLGVSQLGNQAANTAGGYLTDLSRDTAQGISNAGQAQAWGTSNMGNILGGTAGVLGDVAGRLPWQGAPPWNPNQYDQHVYDQTTINAGNQLPQVQEIGGE